MPEENQDIDVSGISVSDMSAEEIDALLTEATGFNEDGAADGDAENTAASTENRAGEGDETATADSPQDHEDTSKTDAAPAGDEGSAETPVETGGDDADDPASALDQVDEDLAELESLLSETVEDTVAGAQAEAEAEAQAEAEAEQEEVEDDSAPLEGLGSDDESAQQEDLPELPTEEIESLVSEVTSDESLQLPEEGEEDGHGSDSESAEPPEPEAVEIEEAPELLEMPMPETFTGKVKWWARHLAETAIVTPFAVIDRPFSRLSPRIKTAAGIVGLATFFVAVMVWIASFFITIQPAA